MSHKATWISEHTARAIHRKLPKAVSQELSYAKAKSILAAKAQLMDRMGLSQKMAMDATAWTQKLADLPANKKIAKRMIKTLLEAEERYYVTVSEGAWAQTSGHD